jgi:hypothetical protein
MIQLVDGSASKSLQNKLTMAGLLAIAANSLSIPIGMHGPCQVLVSSLKTKSKPIYHTVFSMFIFFNYGLQTYRTNRLIK